MSLYSRAETQAQSIKVLNTTEKASVKKYESDGTLVAHDGNTNATAGAEGNAAIGSRVVFIDAVEATLAENTERGLNAPGWWQYTSYTDASGETRHKAQHLAAFKSAPANAADSDDAIAADVASAITISAQPADVAGAADPVTDTFAVTAAATTGTLLYQWQRQTASGTRWTNVTDAGVFSGATTATLTLTAAAKADYDGYKFRVKITSTAGAEEVISDAATLTFA
jgi:quinol monooxygenase YgiN